MAIETEELPQTDSSASSEGAPENEAIAVMPDTFSQGQDAGTPSISPGTPKAKVSVARTITAAPVAKAETAVRRTTTLATVKENSVSSASLNASAAPDGSHEQTQAPDQSAQLLAAELAGREASDNARREGGFFHKILAFRDAASASAITPRHEEQGGHEHREETHRPVTDLPPELLDHVKQLGNGIAMSNEHHSPTHEGQFAASTVGANQSGGRGGPDFTA